METKRVQTASGFTALPSGTVLERYRIDSLIAAGGFGMTYLAHHTTLGKAFALKEHFPRQFAYRDGSTSEVRPTDPDTFTWALDRFIQEGRALASCNHPNVVTVADVFEANSTAYMVLGYEQGRSFKAWLDELRRPPTQAELDRVLVPLLDALEYIHRKGLLHRDIAPDNIMIRGDGSPCLIDFGAARQAVLEKSQVMSAVVKSGFSPPEQYTRSSKAQGPWSDIYALGATLYRAVSGKTPQEAPERQIGDELQPVAALVNDAQNYRAGFLEAIDHSLRLLPRARPQTMAEWRSALLGERPAIVEPSSPTSVQLVSFTELPGQPVQDGGRPKAAVLGGVLVALVLLIGWWWQSSPVRTPEAIQASTIDTVPQKAKVPDQTGPKAQDHEDRIRAEVERRLAEEREARRRDEERRVGEQREAQRLETERRAAAEQAEQARRDAEAEISRRLAEQAALRKAEEELRQRIEAQRADAEAQKRAQDARAAEQNTIAAFRGRLENWLQTVYLKGNAEYADSVLVDGTRTVSRSELADERQRYRQRWPTQDFVLRKTSVTFSHNGSGVLSISFEFDFTVANAPRRESRSGFSRVNLLAKAERNTLVVYEVTEKAEVKNINKQ